LTQPLIALNDDPKGGMIRGMSDSMSFHFHKLFSRSTEKANIG
jgi:hypothetical protein